MGAASSQTPGLTQAQLRLRRAVEEVDSSGVTRLVESRPALLAARDPRDGRTALQTAIVLDRPDLVELLLLGKPRMAVPAILSRDAEGNSALDLASWKRSIRSVKLLLLAGAKVESSPAQRGWTPLHVAAFLDDRAVAGALCSSRGPCPPAAANGDTPLHVAARRHASNATEAILDGGNSISPCARNARGRTALHVACIHGALATARLLAPRIPPSLLNALDTGGLAALHYAARGGLTATCYALLAAGASPSVLSTAGATPAYVAASSGHADVIRVLASAAAEKTRGDGLPLCLRLGIHLKVGPGRQTALHAAAAGNHGAAVAALCEAVGEGSDATDGGLGFEGTLGGRLVDALDGDGATALHTACALNCGAAARELLERGASTTAVDASGVTALDVARRCGSAACIAVLCQR